MDATAPPTTAAVADRYRALAAILADRIAAVPGDRWADPTPCDDWTVRDLVGHLVETNEMFQGLVGREPAPRPSVDEDPLAAWTAASGGVQAILDDPEAAATEYDGMFGRTRLVDTVDRFACFDLVVHRWDLARAVGQDETLEPGEISRLLDDAAALGDSLHMPGVCKPEVAVPDDADDQTKLLATLGRNP